MNDKNKFQEMLADILEVARVQGNQLSTKEIKTLFGDMDLSEAQYDHIYAYLVANHINIAGYVDSMNEYTKAVLQEEQTDTLQEEESFAKDEEKEEEDINNTVNSNKHSEEDSIYLKMYLEDLSAINSAAPGEEEKLIERLQKDNNDNISKSRFIEMNLHYVIDIANEYRNKGIILEDLIQEGNIGLMSSLESINDLIDKKEWKEFITAIIKKFIEAAIHEEIDSSDFENKIIGKIKYINDAANELAEDLGRKADIHELAACTKMSEEEIAEILNMSKDAVKLGDHSHEAENHGHDHNHSHNHNHDCNHQHDHDHGEQH